VQVAPDGEFIIAWCKLHHRMKLGRVVRVAPENLLRMRGAGCTREFINNAWCRLHQRIFKDAWCRLHQRLILERVMQVAPETE
jgi:hypothetical protein